MLGSWQGLYLFEHRLEKHTRSFISSFIRKLNMYSKFGQFIDGKVASIKKQKETYDVINPATEEVIGKASKASST